MDLICVHTMMGFRIRATKAMQPTRTARTLPYSVKIPRPFSDTVVNTRPRIPKGAQEITALTAAVTASEKSFSAFFVVSLAFFSARPKITAQNRIPREVAFTMEPMWMKWQASTATTAAANVPIRYSATTRPIVLPPPS